MALIEPTVDLTTCDHEPIHIIGRIQSFGYLLAFSSDWIISHASENIEELLGRPLEDILGLPAARVLTSSALHDIRSRMQLLMGPDSVERLFGVAVIDDETEYDIAIHRSDRSFIIEFEPSETGRRRDYVGFVRPIMDRLRAATSVEQLCDAAARQLRGLTGFDRVMIYRFEHDGAGEVIAESRAGNVDSFKGLHFPRTDIPQQARELYARNMLRIISDVGDGTVPVLPPRDPHGKALDLSMSTLRAVSPIHIEYLKNMGVEASMSVSIMQGGKLWGLMACHHYSPHHLSYSIRTAAELFGEFFAYLLQEQEMGQAARRRELSTRLHDNIMTRVVTGASMLSIIPEFAEAISQFIPFDGLVGYVDGEFVSVGDSPDKERFARFAAFLNTAGNSTVWSTDNLAAIYPAAADFAEKSAGALAIPVSRKPRDYLVLFRKEHHYQVNWAGNPEKPVELGPNGARLTPRKSFDIWKEDRAGFSQKWTSDEIALADNLRVTLLEVVLRVADATNAQRQEAAQRQDVLIAELNHRVRNILNLIRSLVSQSRKDGQSIEQFSAIISQRIDALARAHDQVTQHDWSPSSLRALIATEAQAYVDGSADRIRVEGPDALIAPKAFTTIALVIHELTTNSCKYGALSTEGGHVAVEIQQDDDGALRLAWREVGGPPVVAPERRGFGSTIIERTIPYELGGTADVEYDKGGLIANFALPSGFVAEFKEPDSASEPPPVKTLAETADDLARLQAKTALVVEDNVIIAMETEDLLSGLGFDRIVVASTVTGAMNEIEAHPVSVAVLDINLGSETSAPIAKKLRELGVPYVVASGYGENDSIAKDFGEMPIITKPFSQRDLQDALNRLERGR